MRDLRRRLLDVLPTSAYQLDRFLQLGEIRFDEVCQTACIEAGPRPILHFNLEFVANYCRTDQSLFMLLMHEMNHLLLGHLTLFGRTTQVHNIVFDAVINAMLCQLFPDPAYTSLFTSFYSWESFPERLLRPPPGWPRNPEPLPEDASIEEREAHAMLYSAPWQDMTYASLFNLLEVEVQKSIDEASKGIKSAAGKSNVPILIGDHSGTNGTGDFDHYAKNDPLISSSVGDIQREIRQHAGRSGELYKATAKIQIAGEKYVLSLLKLISKVNRNALITGNRFNSKYIYPVKGVIPDGKDRKRYAWKYLTGTDLIIQTQHTFQPRSRSKQRRPMDVYLDVSGSMGDKAIGYTMNGLLPLVRKGYCKVFVFSDKVCPISESDLLKGSYNSTYGTSLDCVFEHFFNKPKNLIPKSIVILTDMYVDEPQNEYLHRKKELGVIVAIGLIGRGVRGYTGAKMPIIDLLESIPEPD